ncbi:MAG: hypothetical protein ABR585_11575 [Gemmatimonadaceae bacterium]
MASGAHVACDVIYAERKTVRFLPHGKVPEVAAHAKSLQLLLLIPTIIRVQAVPSVDARGS